MISDKRLQHRVSFFLGGDFYDSPKGERVGRAIVRDVSASGIRLEALVEVEIGKTIYLDFAITEKFPFQRVPVTILRAYRHTGTFLLGGSFQAGSDRRRVRQALSFALQNEV
jgi:hypothetical protein